MSSQPPTAPVCVIAGVGPGNGAAFVRRFAAEGWQVAMMARSRECMDALAASVPQAHAYPCDAGDPQQVEATLAAIVADLGTVDTLVWNAGSGKWGSAEEVPVADFEATWRTNTLGAYVAARQVIPAMKARQSGRILFIGATASRRGGARTVAFAAAKAAQRSLAESLARLLWPSGIHVALVVVDGVIDSPAARARMPDKPDSFFLQADDIAGILVTLARQPRSAWSFEVEARPFGEHW